MNVIQRQFFALNEPDMPDRIAVDGVDCTRIETFKYDFFAATGLYRRGDDRIVVKIYRRRRFFALPMTWFGRLQVNHETRLYRRLAAIEGIPTLVATVAATGFAHAYVPGKPLRRSERPDDLFFDRLGQLIGQIHARDIAYVDLNKSENILLGEDGRPYLVDFQISYAPRRLFFATRFLLRRFQREDRYHLLKHKRRIRPDLLTSEEQAIARRQSWAIKLHRATTRPYFFVRRRVMNLLGLKPAE